VRLILVVLLAVLLGAWAVLRLNWSVAPSTSAVVASRQIVPEPVQPETSASNATTQNPPAEAHGATPDDSLKAEPKPSTNVQLAAPASSVETPASPVNHSALALRYQNLGDFDRARAHYLTALADNEFDVESRNNLGMLYQSQWKTDEAIHEFRRAIRINPRYIKARSNLGAVLTSAGRLAEARAELIAAREIDPRNVDVLVNLALVERADQHPDQAIELLVTAVGIAPDHAVAHYNLALLYDARESLALALTHYTAFLKYASPQHAALLTQVQSRVGAIRVKLLNATR
jgi:tetratricopeptide (TPR) repeat protein